MDLLPLIGSNAGDVVAHRPWCEARKGVLQAIRDGRRVVLLAGVPGSGKTLLLAELGEALAQEGYDILHSPPAVPPPEPLSGNSAPSVPPQGDPVLSSPKIVIADDVDRLDADGFEKLVRLSPRAIILAGVPTLFGERLGASPAAAVVQLDTLRPDEVPEYVSAWLSHTQRSPRLLGDETLSEVATLSGGVPQRINMLVTAALFLVDPDQRSASEDSGAGATPGHAGAAAPAFAHTLQMSGRRHANRSAAPVAAAGIAAAIAVLAWPTIGRWSKSETAPTVRIEAEAPESRRVEPADATPRTGPEQDAYIPSLDRLRQPVPEPVVLPLQERQEAGNPATSAQAPVVPAPSVPLPEILRADAISGAAPAVQGDAEPARNAPTAASEDAPWGSAQTAIMAGTANIVERSPEPPAPTPPALRETSQRAVIEAITQLPAGALPYIVLQYSRRNAGSAVRAAAVAATLRAKGFTVEGPVGLVATTVASSVQYFFAEDRQAAEAALRAAGLPRRGTLLELAGKSQAPRPGAITIVVTEPAAISSAH